MTEAEREAPRKRRHRRPTDAQRDERVKLDMPAEAALRVLLGQSPEPDEKTAAPPASGG